MTSELEEWYVEVGIKLLVAKCAQTFVLEI